MNGTDEALGVTITANGDEAVVSVDQVLASITRLEAGFASASGAGKAMGDGVAAGATTAKESLTGLAAVAQEVEGHSLLIARGFQAAGLEASAAATRVGALTDVLVGFGKAAGPLLLIAAAFEVITRSVTFFTSAVDEASKAQTQMRQIETALEGQGQAWDTVKGHVAAFIEEEARFTGFAQTDLRAAFAEVVNAGHDASDAYQILAVSEDVAKAKGESVAEVTEKIIGAEAGRTRGLLALDPRLKDLIKSHADMDEILTKLARDMKDEAEKSTDDYATAVGRLGVAWSSFKEEVGSWLIPWLKDVVNNMTSVVDAIKVTVEALGTLGHALVDTYAHTHMDENGALVPDADYNPVDQTGPNDAFHKFMDPWAQVQKDQNEARYLANRRHSHIQTGGVHLDRDITPSAAPKSRSSSGTSSFSYTPTDPTTPTGAPGEQDAQSQNKDLLALINTTTDLTEKQRELSQAVSDSAYAQGFYDQAVVSATKQLDAAKAAQDAYGKQLLAQSTPATIDQQNHLAELTERTKEMQTAVDNATKAQEQNRAATAADTAALEENAKAMAELAKKHDEFSAKEAARMAEDLATFQMSNEKKVVYYQQVIDSLKKSDADYEQEYENAVKLRDDAEIASYKDRLTAAADFYKQVQGFESTLVDDFIVGHKSIGDSFKDMLSQMLDDYKKWIAEMLVQSTMKSLNNSIGAMFGFGPEGGPGGSGGGYGIIGAQGASNAAAGASEYGIVGALAGPTGAQQILAAVPTMGGSGSSAVLGSGATVVSGANAAGGASAGGGILGALMGVGADGVIGQDIGGALTGGNSIGKGLGAALGVGTALDLAAGGSGLLGSSGLMAMFAMNPATIGIALAAGVLGSGIIGPHWGPATNYPDRSDTSNYGQFLANWQGGNPMVNGTRFNAASQYNTQDGGTPEIDQMEQWADGLGSNTSGLTPNQLSAYQQIEALMGGNTNANLGIANEKNGVLTLGNGQTLSVTQAEALVNLYQGGAGGSSVSPVFTVTHTMPNANLTTSTQTGTYTETGTGTSYLGGVPVAPATAPGGSTGTAGGGAAAGGTTVNVTIQNAVGLSATDLANSLAAVVGAQLRGVGTGVGASPYRRSGAL